MDMQDRKVMSRANIALCVEAQRLMAEYQAANGGNLPLEVFNEDIKRAPRVSPEIVVYRRDAGGGLMFRLAMRNIEGGTDVFNGQWHYTGGLLTFKEYPVEGARRVIRKELGGCKVRSFQLAYTIVPLHSPRGSDITCQLFATELEEEPSNTKEVGCWFTLDEVMNLRPMEKYGIVPSHLVGVALVTRKLTGTTPASPWFTREGSHFEVSCGTFSQKIQVVDQISVSDINL